MNFKKDFRISYKAARHNKNLTIKEAAKALEFSESALFKYENKKMVPSWERHEKMAKFYEVPSENLRP